MNIPALIGGFLLFVCYTFIMVGTATNTWRQEEDGVSYFDKEYGLWELCFNGNDCEDVEEYLLPGQSQSALDASRAFALLACILGLISVPCLCAGGIAGKCFCLRGMVFGVLAFVSIVCMQLCAIIAFAVFIGVVQDQFEVDSSIWEYGYSFALFTTGWTVSCIIGPVAFALSAEDD